PGGTAEYGGQWATWVLPTPDGPARRHGAMVETARRGLRSVKRAVIEPGDAVVVVGPGPMGILTADCALALGAATVIVTGSGDRLARAAELGFVTVDYRREDPVQEVRRLTEGKGAHAAIDTAGTSPS